MSWSAITADDVERKLSALELTSVQSSKLASGQTNPTTAAIDETTEEVREYIRAGGNTLGTAGTLPDGHHSRALHIVVYELLCRLPGTAKIEEQRIKNAEKARTYFEEKIATGIIKVEDPDTGESSSPSPSFSGRDRKFTESQEDGI